MPPVLPDDLTDPLNDLTIQGELGVLTGAAASIIELDVDNDKDGIREGIWVDLRFPVQQNTDGGSVMRTLPTRCWRKPRS